MHGPVGTTPGGAYPLLTLLMVMGMLACVSVCFAAPFIVCDAPPEEELVTSYVVTMDGGAAIEVDAPLHYDLAGVPDGTYSVVVEAKNLWGGGSPSVPFEFTKGAPSIVVGVEISIE